MAESRKYNKQKGWRMNVRRFLVCALALAAFGLTTSMAVAGVTEGEYDFHWDHNEYGFLTFPNGDYISQLTYGPADGWVAYVDSTGTIISFDGNTSPLHDTTHSVAGATVQAQLYISQVTGEIATSTSTANWTITAQVRFQDSTAGINTATCRTGTFTIHFSGSWASGDSDYFTIPSLSGSGSGACGGYASTLNSDFDLGAPKAYLWFNKFWVTLL